MQQVRNLILYFGPLLVLPHLLVLYVLPTLDSEPLSNYGTKLLVVLYLLLSSLATFFYSEITQSSLFQDTMLCLAVSVALVNAFPIPQEALVIYTEVFPFYVNIAVVSGVLGTFFFKPFLDYGA